MESDEIKRRFYNSGNKSEESYWGAWLEDLEYAQFIEAIAIINEWDKQILEMIKNGYLVDHPYRQFMDNEANTNHDPQNMPDNPPQD